MVKENTIISILHSSFNLKHEKISPNSVIIKSNEHLKKVFIVEEGIVKYTLIRNRKKHSIDYFGSNSIHGASAFHNVILPLNVEAATPVIVKIIAVDRLKNAPQIQNIFSEFSLKDIQEKIQLISTKMSDLIYYDSKKLILLALIKLAHLNGSHAVYRITKRELANYANCSVEYVFRTLSYFEKSKLIRVEKKEILLLLEEINRYLLWAK